MRTARPASPTRPARARRAESAVGAIRTGRIGRARRTERAATPIAFVKAVLLAFDKYRADPSNALQEAGIAPSLLRQPDARVTASQFEALCSAAMQQLDDEALGWFSRRLPWGSYGMLCRASLPSPDLGVALKRWCRHHRLLTDDVVFDFSVDGEIASLSIEEKRPLGAMREFCLVTSLRYIHGYACWLIDSRIPLVDVAFPFERPPWGDVHGLLFPGPVRFGASRAGLGFAAQYLSLSPRRDERALRAMLQRALPLTVLQYRRDRILASRVRRLLSERAGERDNAHTIALALNVSVRTLHRQLDDEGTSLQAIKDDMRRAQAIEQLSRTTRPIKQVARSVGYASEKSFARAFRQWTGQSPSEFRRKGGLPA